MTPIQLWQDLKELVGVATLIVAFFNLGLLWKLYTNHLPHIYEALRRIASKTGVDISDLN